MMDSRLPIGIQTFQEIRENGLRYVDKTPWIRRLVGGGKHYFLSRPRRFGKSLLVDTMKELFEGNEALFEGLHIHDRWDWAVRHPVVRLSFDGNFADPGILHPNLAQQLEEAEQWAALEPPSQDLPNQVRFRRLVDFLHRSTGQKVVVLVDEYDKPILDALGAPDVAVANRDYLQGIYAVIKGCDAHIRFSFLTGVSGFSKVSLFSGLNNLKDITLDPHYAAICGYQERDLDEVFAEELEGFDRERIREWYNGYSWGGEPDKKVYNPFDALLLFDTREFRDHWFQTGSPSFLVEMLKRRTVVPLQLENMACADDLLSKFEIDDIGLEALLFQTGYLTVKKTTVDEDGAYYRLGYPNREVRQSLNRLLLPLMGGDGSWRHEHRECLRAMLAGADFEGIEALFRSLLKSIPYEWHMNNSIARYEGWYASLFYCWFAAVGLNPQPKASMSDGRADMIVKYKNQDYVFEFKAVDDAPTGEAMAQLIERGYADAYRTGEGPVHLVAVEFSRKSRNIADFQAKTV